MNWILRTVLVLSIVPLMAFTCTKDEGPDCHQHMDFTNESDHEIIVFQADYYAKYYNSIEDYKISIESYKSIKKRKDYPGCNNIPAGETARIVDMIGDSMCIEGHLKHFADCWIFFILDAKTVDESTPEELTDGRAILDKIYYYYDDIQRLGTHLVYR